MRDWCARSGLCPERSYVRHRVQKRYTTLSLLSYQVHADSKSRPQQARCLGIRPNFWSVTEVAIQFRILLIITLAFAQRCADLYYGVTRHTGNRRADASAVGGPAE